MFQETPQGLGDASHSQMMNDHARQRPAHRRPRELGSRADSLTHVLTPHVSTPLAPVAAHAHMHDSGAPPVRLVSWAPDHHVSKNALATAISALAVITCDPAS